MVTVEFEESKEKGANSIENENFAGDGTNKHKGGCRE